VQRERVERLWERLEARERERCERLERCPGCMQPPDPPFRITAHLSSRLHRRPSARSAWCSLAWPPRPTPAQRCAPACTKPPQQWWRPVWLSSGGQGTREGALLDARRPLALPGSRPPFLLRCPAPNPCSGAVLGGAAEPQLMMLSGFALEMLGAAEKAPLDARTAIGRALTLVRSQGWQRGLGSAGSCCWQEGLGSAGDCCRRQAAVAGPQAAGFSPAPSCCP
jgi:hypothetical protein